MRLLLQHARSAPAPSIVMAVVVLLATIVTALAPALMAALATAELRGSLSSLAVERRDLVSTVVGPIPFLADDADPYRAVDDSLEQLRAGVGSPLEELLGPADYVSRSDSLSSPADRPDRDAPLTFTRIAIDPGFTSRVRIVSGRQPERADLDAARAIEIVLSAPSATAMRWAVDERRTTPGGLSLLLVGTFEAVDADDRYWRHAPSVLDPQLLDDGNSTPQVTAVGYAHPLSAPAIPVPGARTTVWFALDPSPIDIADAAAIAPLLRKLTTTPVPLPVAPGASPQNLAFTSDTVRLLDLALERTATLSTLALTIASGPLGVLAAVLTLAARPVINRRRAALELSFVRGASRRQLSGTMALEGLAIGVPAMIGGIALAALLSGAPSLAALIVPLMVGLAPPVLLAAMARAIGFTPRERASPRGGRRLLAEATLTLICAAAVIALVTRGPASPTGALAADPLLIALPLLVALTASVAVARSYPLIISGFARRYARGRDLVGFLGSMRASRDRATSITAVLAIVVAVSVSVLSGVVLATVDNGISAATRYSVGGDVRVDSAVALTPELIAEASTLDGVTALAALDRAAPSAALIDSVRATLQLVIANTDAYAQLRSLPSDLNTRRDGVIPIVLSRDLAEAIEPDSEILVGASPVAVVGILEKDTALAGVPSPWAIVDSAFAEELTGTVFRPTVLLVDVEHDGAAVDVAAALGAIAGSATTVTVATLVEMEARSAPTVFALRLALATSMGASILLAMLAVILSALAGSPARGRLLALMTALGVGRRQQAGLVAWELAPPAVAAVVGGGLLGIALPFVVIHGIDLRPFSGGGEQPSVTFDFGLIAATVGSLVVVVGIAVTASWWRARRTSPSSTLRMGAP